MLKRLKNEKGFTLIELLIVIVIIGILAGIVIGLTGANARKKANDAANKATIHEAQNALETYFTDNDAYPADWATLVAAGNLTAAPSAKGGETISYVPANGNTTYTLSVTLQNTSDTGPNVVAGPPVAYEVTNKQ